MSDMDDYWKHKTRALLLPTPLAEADVKGEDRRVDDVLEWLRLDRTSRAKLHEDAIRDAEGVHVPDTVRSIRRPSHVATENQEVPLRALVHPLSGERSRGAADATLRRDELSARFAEWKEQWPTSPPHDSRSFSEFWHELYAAAATPRHALWLGQAPGHPTLRDHTWLAQRTMASALVGARVLGGDPCLLHVHCGPVQSFIAAARRTSDLWLGSYLVSMLAYQAAKTIAEACGPDSIIYPHLASLPLAQRDRLDRSEADIFVKQQWLRASQPNRFVAVVDSGRAEDIAKDAAHAVRDRWASMAGKVRDGLKGIIGKEEIDPAFAGFDQQVADQLEIDIVVQPWPGRVEDVRTMLTAAEREVEPTAPGEAECTGQYYEHVFGLGRDTLGAQRRVVSLSPNAGDQRIKCTQCGRREAMGPLTKRRSEWNTWWDRLRTGLSDKNRGAPTRQETVEFRRGEALCAVCLTKRLACRFDLGGPNSELGLDWKKTEEHRVLLRFPSLASIAAAPLRLYLLEQGAHRDVQQWLERLREVDGAIDFTAPGNLLPGLGEVGRRKNAVLDHDGTWLYARSYERDTVLNDHDLQEGEATGLEPKLEDARKAFGKLGPMMARELGMPKGRKLRATPYYAVVVLDVDEMGKWLDGSHRRRPKLWEVLEHAGTSVDEVLDALAEDERFIGLSAAEARERAKDVDRPVSSALHAEVSRRQGEMATKTLREVVEHDHLGRVVYSGGDDVLAFVPLHTLWGCLRDVERAFRADEALGSKVGLSAGVAIHDWRSPLSLALRSAREAEGKAKKTRGCVVVDLEIRSGAPIELQLPWRLLDPESGDWVGDLGDLSTMVTRLAAAGDRAEQDEGDTPPLLRPSAVEVLRRELETLSHEGLERAFAQRVHGLLKVDAGEHPWLDQMMMMKKPLVEFLLLLRFLVREQGGIHDEQLYDKIAKHKQRMRSQS